MSISFLIVSCGLFGDNDNGIDCLYDYITVENQCGQDIFISYNDQPDEFDWIEFIFGINNCDVVERNEIIPPGEEIEISVFLGLCSKSGDSIDYDSCDSFGFGYWSDESIVVQYGEVVRNIPIDFLTHITIRPEDFD